MDVRSIASHEVQATGTTLKPSRKRSTITFIVICVVNVALLVLFWTQVMTPAPNKQHADTSTGSVYGLEDANSPLLGKPAPNFSLPLLSTGSSTSRINLSAFKGKPIILNFWASWCGPCNDEAPFLQKSWSSIQAQHIVLLGIDGSEKTSDAIKFMQHYKISYPNVQDTLTSSTALDYGITGLPETIFIDRQGKVRAKWNSPLTAQGLQHEIAKIVQ